MKNKNLVIFMGIGFIVTVVIWGFVGGCGTIGLPWKARPPSVEEPGEAEGLMLEEPAVAGDQTVYIVEAGDTLWGISTRYGVSVPALKEANRLTSDTIAVGQRLVIPGPVETSSRIKSRRVAKPRPVGEEDVVKGELVVYRVRKGDSLWRIAQVHGTTVDRIAELNGIPRNAGLVPGQELLIPKNKR